MRFFLLLLMTTLRPGSTQNIFRRMQFVIYFKI